MTRTRTATAVVTTLLALGASAAVAAPSPQDFVKMAIEGDNSEIMLGQLAQQKGASQKTRDFGATLVSDHSAAKQQAGDVATTLGVTPPDGPSADARAELSKLETSSGTAFDREFADYMVTDHEKDIRAFQDQEKANDGPASGLAAKQLPVLQKHLGLAEALVGGLKQTGSSESVRSAPTQEAADQWRASKLAGVAIYGPNNTKVGTVTDILLDPQGRADYVVIGVGGFLGIGEKDVAIPYSQVKFTDTPAAAGGSASASTAGDKPMAYPNHGIIDMTADQLKNAPSFHFAG